MRPAAASCAHQASAKRLWAHHTSQLILYSLHAHTSILLDLNLLDVAKHFVEWVQELSIKLASQLLYL